MIKMRQVFYGIISAFALVLSLQWVAGQVASSLCLKRGWAKSEVTLFGEVYCIDVRTDKVIRIRDASFDLKYFEERD